MFNNPHYIRHIPYYLLILKPDYRQTDTLQIRLFSFIRIHNVIILMRKSVKFYHQPYFLTIKINNIITNRLLTNKAKSIHLTAFQLVP